MSSDKGILTDEEKISIYGTSKPQGNLQINSVIAPRLSGGSLHCTGDSWIYGDVRPRVNMPDGIRLSAGTVESPSIMLGCCTGIYESNAGNVVVAKNGAEVLTLGNGVVVFSGTLTTPGGQNLTLNPTGPYIDCSGKTLINVGGLPDGSGSAGNPNRYVVTSNELATTNNTPALLLSIPTVANAAYVLVGEIVAVNITDGLSMAGFMVSATAKNINGVITVSNPMEINTSKDQNMTGVSVKYVAGTNVELQVVGLDNATVKWFGSVSVTRQLF